MTTCETCTKEDALGTAQTTEKPTGAPSYQTGSAKLSDLLTSRGAASTDARRLLDTMAAALPKSGAWSMESSGHRKLSRAMMPAWKVRQLKVQQGGLCAVCGLPVDLTQDREGVVDHSHDTGEIRGVLHRSCNSALGKMENVVGSWGAKDMSYDAIINFMLRALVYYATGKTGLIYPTHVDAATASRKTADKRNLAAKERRAKIKAARAMRDNRNPEGAQ